MSQQDAIRMFDMKIGHVGINGDSQEQAAAWAADFLRLLGLPTKEGEKSVWAGDLVEIMKGNGRGTVGHIAIKVNDCDKAIEYFKSRGMTPAEETRKVENGRTVFIYFEEEIAGFAIHLNQA